MTEEKAAMLRHLTKTDYLTFARKAFRTASGEELSDDRYVEVICKAALDVFNGKTRRQVLNMPPRHAKTLLYTVSLAAWELAHRPTAKVMVVSYSEGLARFISDKIRDVIAAKWFKAAFATRLREGHNRTMDFATTAGGRVFANHMGPGITGHGADLIIIDDPADIEHARAPHRLAEANETFDGTIRNRLNHNQAGRIVIVAHRIHPDDLSGHVLREGGWTHIKLPLVAERDDTYVTPYGKWRRRKGDLLRRDEFSDAEVQSLRTKATIPDFDTLYQQSPLEASWRITSEDFPRFDAVPATAGGIVLSIDAGHVPGDRNSFSVIQAWRSAGNSHFLVDEWREQVVPRELENATRSFIRRYLPRVVLIESASAGIMLLTNLKHAARRSGMVLEAIQTGNRSKFSRFSEIVPIILARSVHLPTGATWTPVFVVELTSFPSSRTDDQADATAQYLAWQATHPWVEPAPPRPMGTTAMPAGNFVAGELGHSPFRGRRSKYVFVRDR